MVRARRFAERMDLAKATPQGDISSTGYCLAAPGKEYLVYQPAAGGFQVRIEGKDGAEFVTEWFDPKTRKTVPVSNDQDDGRDLVFTAVFR